MRVLILTRAPWRNDNNTGNTLTNLFSGMDNLEISNLYLREQLPDNDITIRNFSISEIQLIKNLLKGELVGREVTTKDEASDATEANLYSVAKKKSNAILTWLREVLWLLGKWRNDNLKEFLRKINPDVIFVPMFCFVYPYRVLQFLQKYTSAKVMLFHPDDNYTLKQFSFSPIYWIYRFALRKWVRNTVRIASINYAISNLQKEEYEIAFQKSFKVITKGLDFNEVPQYLTKNNRIMQLVFTGNIGTNRWKSLKMIADALEKINQDCIKAQLRIYTATPVTKKMEKALSRGETSILMGSVPASEVPGIQERADILVHVEALDLKNRLTVRQSFSTKIVDYLKAARPILAVGPKDVASIDHLIRNNCAITAENSEELERKLREVLADRATLRHIAENGYECGRKYHNRQDIQTMLMNDLNAVCNH